MAAACNCGTPWTFLTFFKLACYENYLLQFACYKVMPFVAACLFIIDVICCNLLVIKSLNIYCGLIFEKCHLLMFAQSALLLQVTVMILNFWPEQTV